MKTSMALAISLAISTSALAADPINIKGMQIGMSVNSAVKTLSKAMELSQADFIVIKVDNNACIFTATLKEEMKDGAEDACRKSIGNMVFMLALSYEYIIQNLQVNLKEYLEYSSKGEKVPVKPIKQPIPLATFVNDKMVTMTLEAGAVNKIFSYGESDFRVFAKGLVDAYDIPGLTHVKCSYEQHWTCWEYNNGDGEVLSLMNKQTDALKIPPTISLFMAEKVKPLRF